MHHKLLTLCVAAAALYLGPGPALTHHSDIGLYSETPVTLDAIVVELRLINPHTIILIDEETENGELVRWQIESGSRSQLARRGWNDDTLKPGDRITVTALPAINGARILNEATIVMTDSGEEILTRRP